MRIAMLSTFYPFRGGIAQFNANLYETLKKDNDTTAYTFTRQYPAFLFPGKTQYVTGEDNAKPIDSHPVLDSANPLMYRRAAAKIAAAGVPDLLVMKYWMTYLAPSLGTVAGYLKKRGCRVVTILDNVIPHEQKFFDRPLTKWFLKQNSGFVAMSESVRGDLYSLCPGAKSILKPHPLYNHFGKKADAKEARLQLGLDPRKKTLLFFGLIRDYKGLDLLIDAVSQLDESYQLLIAGETYGSFDKYDDHIRRAHHPGRIKVFNRYISDSEVPLFFSAADVCVLPYRTATQSGITSIAYHFELPLIATNTGGLGESIEKPGVGLMVPEITPGSIADTITRYFREDRSRFIANIQEEKKSLSWENFATSLLSFAGSL